MATHATGVTNLHPRVDRQALAERLARELDQAIVAIHDAEHANVRMVACANPICVAFVAREMAA